MTQQRRTQNNAAAIDGEALATLIEVVLRLTVIETGDRDCARRSRTVPDGRSSRALDVNSRGEIVGFGFDEETPTPLSRDPCRRVKAVPGVVVGQFEIVGLLDAAEREPAA